EAAAIALAARAEPAVLEAAVLAGAAWLEWQNDETRAAHALIGESMGAFPLAHAFRPDLLRLALECANRLGDADLIKSVLNARVSPRPSGDPKALTKHAAFDLRRAEHMVRTGDVAQAEALTREAQTTFRSAGDERGAAVAAGQIADILQSRGEVDEALRVLREEQLPVYERIGDARGRSATLFKIASALLDAGGLEAGRVQEIDDALAESFGIAVRLGQPDGVGTVGAVLAQVLAVGGHHDDALDVLNQAEAAFRKLGDGRGVGHVQELRKLIGGN